MSNDGSGVVGDSAGASGEPLLIVGVGAVDRAWLSRTARAVVELWRGQGFVPTRPLALAEASGPGDQADWPSVTGRCVHVRAAEQALPGDVLPAYGRVCFDFTGPGGDVSAPTAEQHDPSLSLAMTVLAAHKQARLAGVRAGFGRTELEPNRLGTIPTRARGWLEIRAARTTRLQDVVAAVVRLAGERASRDGTRLRVHEETLGTTVATPGDVDRAAATLADALRPLAR